MSIKNYYNTIFYYSYVVLGRVCLEVNILYDNLVRMYDVHCTYNNYYNILYNTIVYYQYTDNYY